MLASKFLVDSPNVNYSESQIISEYVYRSNEVKVENERVVVSPKEEKFTFRTQTTVPRMGVMLVGLGGNNGSTVIAGAIANREGITW